jgi:transposase-like protein
MKGHGSKFGRKKEAAIAALLTARSIEEAARAAGIGTATLFRWQNLPEFQQAYRDAKRAVSSKPMLVYNRLRERPSQHC